ncbi:MAG TPA: DCC1-like thiol-disulfide oxidoreductase family protein [Chitinophagales bacterium]|nr:DCC1-like thiol-disulfide oxidoreductase family protein [Chitinophagales bacterium]
MNSKEIDKIVLFDGVCNLCDYSVQFILKHDKSQSLRFASLQSEIGKEILSNYNYPQQLDGVVFIENSKLYSKSAAAFRISRYFGGYWSGLQLLTIVPSFITDFFYNVIAKYRYKWWGKKETCLVPSKETIHRFL